MISSGASGAGAITTRVPPGAVQQRATPVVAPCDVQNAAPKTLSEAAQTFCTEN
jgi:hypothetical protein